MVFFYGLLYEELLCRFSSFLYRKIVDNGSSAFFSNQASIGVFLASIKPPFLGDHGSCDLGEGFPVEVIEISGLCILQLDNAK